MIIYSNRGSRGGGRQANMFAVLVHEHCKSRGTTTDTCDGCMFLKRDGFCMIGAPITWDVAELKKELGIG